MKISSIIQKEGKSLSFEFFPPKTPQGEANLFERIKRLSAYNPSFISVTQHAGPATLEKTKNIVRALHDKTNLTVMPHITCADPRKSELQPVINYYQDIGIENVLALRGDIEEYSAKIFDGDTHFRYAADLVKFIAGYSHFCVGVAVYPECHHESPNAGLDIAYTKKKIDKGAEFGITQMFFENFYFYQMMDRFEQAGINVPIIAGIMPITDFAKVESFCETSHVEIPIPMIRRFEEAPTPQDVIDIGIELATEQCLDLWENGIRCFHFYTLNRDEDVNRILKNLAPVFGLPDIALI